MEANQVIRYFPEQNAAYVRIKQMTNDPDDGKELLDFFATLEERGYEHCIIDIRGNTGGDTMHWMAYIVGPNFAEMPRCDSGLGLNPDGSANSEVGTAPDYECESGRALDYCLELIEAGK